MVNATGFCTIRIFRSIDLRSIPIRERNFLINAICGISDNRRKISQGLCNNILNVLDSDLPSDEYYDYSSVLKVALQLKHDDGSTDYKQLCARLVQSYRLNQNAGVFFPVIRLLNKWSKRMANTSLPKSVYILKTAINLSHSVYESRLEADIQKNLLLCNLYESLNRRYYKYAVLKNSLNKYREKILALDERAQGILSDCIVKIQKRLPKVKNDEVYSEYLTDVNAVSDFSTAAALKFTLWGSRRKYNFGMGSDKNQEHMQLTEIKNLLVLSLIYNPTNPHCILSLIRVKKKLHEDIRDIVESIDFLKFGLFHKISLCNLLLYSKYHNLGVSILKKFGFLNSSSPKERKDILGIYLKAQLWGHAIRLYEGAKIQDKSTLSAVKLLAEELPANEQRLSIAKKGFSNMYKSFLESGSLLTS